MKWDICIVGSGAGAGPVAYELSNKGYNVVVLEKGEYYTEADFSKDELAISRRDFFSPNLEDEFHIIYQKDTFTKEVKRYNSQDGWSFWNGSLVGGSSNLMSGYFHKLEPVDFKLLSTFGEIEGANISDWPIEYKDLEPYYKMVEDVVGVSGNSKPFPPLQENKVAELFDISAKALGFKPLRTARAILSKEAFGRGACYYSNFCGSYPCASGAKGSSRAALLNRSKATIIPNAFVYRLESTKTRVTKAHYYDKKGNSHTIEAKIFVVAAQAIETSRLLLNSKSIYFPNGLANNSNNVGKNLIFSGGGSGSGRLWIKDLDKRLQQELLKPGVFFNRSLKEWYVYEKNGKKQKGGVIDFLFEHQNIISRVLRASYQDGKLLWGKSLQENIYKELTQSRVLTFEVFNDWLATNDCYVGIEEGVKDKWGVDVAAIHLYSHKRDQEVGEDLSKKAIKVLEQMGAKDINYSISQDPPANLQAGGCRFGDDPKSSVLDKNCKAWELDNLFVTDASFMPNGGSVPYTWTIYANSFRVAGYISNSLENFS